MCVCLHVKLCQSSIHYGLIVCIPPTTIIIVIVIILLLLLLFSFNAGQERFRTLTQRYYDNVDGVIIVYSCEDEESFGEIMKYWYPEVMRYVAVDDEIKVPVLIVENKKDLIGKVENTVKFEHAKELAHQKNLLPPLQCSALNGGDEVKKVFHAIATEIFKLRRKTTSKTRVKMTTQEPKSGCCVKGSGRRRNEKINVVS